MLLLVVKLVAVFVCFEEENCYKYEGCKMNKTKSEIDFECYN